MQSISIRSYLAWEHPVHIESWRLAAQLALIRSGDCDPLRKDGLEASRQLGGSGAPPLCARRWIHAWGS